MSKATTETAVSKVNPAMLAELSEELMDETPVEVEDITIPKLLLQQSQSQFFKDGKSKIGEIRGSMECNLVVGAGEEVEFIPFKMFKTWVVLKAQGGSFVEEIPYEKGSLDREGVKDGVQVRNYQTINYYCLLPKDIEKGVYMPYVISFRSTSYTAGKTLETKRALLQEFKKPIAVKTFKLWSKADRNDDGNDYQTFNIAESRDTTPEELKAVAEWHRIIKTKSVVVDNSEQSAPQKKREDVADNDEF